MDYAKYVQKTFKIGKERAGAPPEHVFDLRRREDGGLIISNVKVAPTDHERRRLFVHFGAPIDARIGGEDAQGNDWQGRETRQAGDPKHFVTAVMRLPPPFILLSSKE